jgi:hypothetical protein
MNYIYTYITIFIWLQQLWSYLDLLLWLKGHTNRLKKNLAAAERAAVFPLITKETIYGRLPEISLSSSKYICAYVCIL